MGNPFNIPNYEELPLKVRTYLSKEWSNRDKDRAPIGRPSKYPWDEWMNGRIHTVLAGRDFHTSVAGFRNLLYQKAYHAGQKVWSQVQEVHEMGPTGPVQYRVTFRIIPKSPVEPSDPDTVSEPEGQ